MVESQTGHEKGPDYTTTCLYVFKDFELNTKRDKPSQGFKDFFFFTYII